MNWTDKVNGNLLVLIERNNMAISENKLLHIIGVARECERLAKEAGLTEREQTACFVMGFLHDIGYERTTPDNATEHPYIGADMITDFLETDGIVETIRAHGHKFENLSIYDRILNQADLTTDFRGNHVTIDERLDSIAFKYGKANKHYITAVKQTNTIRALT